MYSISFDNRREVEEYARDETSKLCNTVDTDETKENMKKRRKLSFKNRISRFTLK